MPDLKEAFDAAIDLPDDDPDYLAGNPMLGPNTWPDLPGFAEAGTEYYQAVLEVRHLLLRAIAVALQEDPDVFPQHVIKTPSQLRLVYCPFDPNARDGLGIGAHTDYESSRCSSRRLRASKCSTVQASGSTSPRCRGPCVVNIGDLLELWTNGAFIATSHRVRRVAEKRYSFPLFFTSTTTPR